MEEVCSKPGWGYHIAISDNGKEVVKFGIREEGSEVVGYLTAYEINGNEISKASEPSYKIDASYIQEAYDRDSTMPTWSLAISNANNNGKTLIAFSYFPTKEIYETNSDLESVCSSKKRTFALSLVPNWSAPSRDCNSTYVLVMDRNNPDKWVMIQTPLDKVAGVVNFVSDPDSDMWLLTVSNEGGIFQYNIDPEHTEPYKETGVWQRDIPMAYRHNMKDKWKGLHSKAYFQFLVRTIKSHVYFEPDPKKKILRVYNLRDGRHLFDLHHHGDPSLTCFDTPVLAISKNGALLAVSLDTTSINIYLMENGLECGRKDATKSHRIVLIEFINNDECLLIIREAKETHELVATVWELFTCRPDRTIKKINLPDYFFYKRPNLYGVRWAGNTAIFVTDKGELKLVLDCFDPEEEKVSGGEDPPIVADKQLEYSTVYELDEKTYRLPDSKLTQLIIRRIEPWIPDGNKIIGVWLDESAEGKNRRQLLIGRGCIQIWKLLPDDQRLLLYIYANEDIITDPKVDPKITITIYKDRFDLTIKREDVLQIRWPVDPSKVVIDACKALEWLDKKKNKNHPYERRVLFDEIKHQISNIVRIFIKHHPDEWSLLEVRHDLMKSLIIGGCSRLTQDLIKVSDDENNNKEGGCLLHIPRKYSWRNANEKLEKKDTDIMMVIEKNNRLTENFLTYYAHHAKKHYGWMHTVGGALSALSELESSKAGNLDIPTKRLLAHSTFAGHSLHDHEHPSASYATVFRWSQVIHDDLEPLTRNDVIASLRYAYLTKAERTVLSVKLRLEQSKRQLRQVKLGTIVKGVFTPFSFALKTIAAMFDARIKIEMLRMSYSNDPMALINTVRRIPVPVDAHVVGRLLEKAVDEDNGIFLDNPVISGIIDHAWKGESYLYLVFLFLFFSYLIVFDAFVWQYIHQNNSNYAVAVYLFVIGTYYILFRLTVMYNRRKRLTFYDVVDLCSYILPIVTTAVLTFRATHDDNGVWGFGQTEISRNMLFLISISTFIMWLRFLLLLRLFEGETRFLEFRVFYVNLVFNTAFAFGQAMYVLLHDPIEIGLSPNILQLGVNVTTPNGDVEQTNYTVYQNYNPQDASDNNFANFWISVLSSYNWMNGRWDNVDWNYYPVTIFTVVASLLLVIIMLNILIAIMGDIYTAAKEFGEREILRLRVRFMLDTEYFGNKVWRTAFPAHRPPSRFEDVVKKNPRYMYVLGNRQQFERWVEEGERFRELTKPQKVQQEKLTDHRWFKLEDNDSG
ncbi:3162_t:CDS:2 [Paraglomus brasilianum]|uniref:3162_t:CDS:1 n=1 Tax=Paraglomus brasilianum TaxID=144538 RepID=A0A9N9GCV9_9GLOM|nr:3162_t:CDS:2 [Paraglomus brasilianum]